MRLTLEPPPAGLCPAPPPIVIASTAEQVAKRKRHADPDGRSEALLTLFCSPYPFRSRRFFFSFCFFRFAGHRERSRGAAVGPTGGTSGRGVAERARAARGSFNSAAPAVPPARQYFCLPSTHCTHKPKWASGVMPL